ncbi:MAG TPA: OmpA family protein [Alphaproteobacteria bacterium]|nr:OmpA family protein [Alphaproteobacteria bacterium]
MKKISFFKFIVFTALFLTPLAFANADTVPGWYIGAGVIGSQPIDSTANVGSTNNKVDYDFGWGVLGELGYAWHDGWRTEGEFAYARSNVNKVNGVTENSGRINNLYLMGNLYYDFQTGTRWTPYVGGGLGLAAPDADHIGVLSNGGDLNDSDFQFAYQAIAGVAYELTDHLALSADYRYVGTTDPVFKTTAGGTGVIDNQSHNVVLTLRYAMHAAPHPLPPLVEPQKPAPIPAPAPVPAPKVEAPPPNYMVFFNFDRSSLTPEARKIVREAADTFKRQGYVRIVITGHTDTVGTDAYNQKLSERRAASVKMAMMRLGIPAREISAIGVGKHGLLVPTADQIREAQNRRAEIVFNAKQ